MRGNGGVVLVRGDSGEGGGRVMVEGDGGV